MYINDNEDMIEMDVDDEPASQKVKTFKDVIIALEDVRKFLQVVDISKHIVC